jgi:hypothetical protein
MQSRTVGGVGRSRQTGTYTEGVGGFKRDKQTLYKSMEEFNAKCKAVQNSMASMRASVGETVFAQCGFLELPALLSKEQLKDPLFVVPDVGESRITQSVVGVLDCLRELRCIVEECGAVGRTRAQALSELWENFDKQLSDRIVACTNLLSSKQEDLNDELATAVSDGGRGRLMRSYFPHAMLVPSDHTFTSSSVADNLYIAGHRSQLIHVKHLIQKPLQDAKELIALWPEAPQAHAEADVSEN